MPAKIRLKVGSIELECEGEEGFLKEEVPRLLKVAENLRAEQNDDDIPKNGKRGLVAVGKDGQQLSTSLIAGKLNCRKGTELIEAAAFFLVGVKQKESFTRDELINEMRAAKAFFKRSYVSNLSNYLKTLAASQRLNELGGDIFSMPHDALGKMKDRLGI